MKIVKSKLLICSEHEQFLGPIYHKLKNNYEVQTATSEPMALFLMKEWEPQVCVLDAQSSLFDLVKSLRKKQPYSKLGIITISESESPSKEEMAFKEGIDHFLVVNKDSLYKAELRIESLAKRILKDIGTFSHPTPNLKAVSESAPNSLEIYNIKINPQNFSVSVMDKRVSISPTQFRLLMAFVSHTEQLLSREWLKEVVWDNSDISSRSIDAHISKLKKLLPSIENHIINVYGKGYILTKAKKEAA